MRSLLVPTIAEALEYGYGALANPDDLYLSPQWLKVEEKIGLVQSPSYILCLAGEGHSPVVAAAWAFLVDEANWWPFVRIDMVFSKLLDERNIPVTPRTKEVLHSLLPNVVVGPFRGGTTSLRVHPDISAELARVAAAEILSEIEIMARAEGLRSVALPYVPAENRPLRDALRESGYMEFGLAHNVSLLRIESQSFDGYLSGLDRHRKASIKAERRKIADSGVQIGLEELSRDLSQEMMPLEAQLFERYGHPRYPVGLMTRQYAIVASEYPGAALVITARSAGILRGFHSFIRTSNILYSRETGYDYAWKKSLPLYFEVVFYRTIELAMRSGIREIAYSFGSEQTKASRGCDLHQRVGYIKAFDAKSSAELECLCADLCSAGAVPALDVAVAEVGLPVR